ARPPPRRPPPRPNRTAPPPSPAYQTVLPSGAQRGKPITAPAAEWLATDPVLNRITSITSRSPPSPEALCVISTWLPSGEIVPAELAVEENRCRPAENRPPSASVRDNAQTSYWLVPSAYTTSEPSAVKAQETRRNAGN